MRVKLHNLFILTLICFAPLKGVLANDSYSELEIGVGVFGVSLPDYPGSEEQSNYLVPLPYIYYQDERFEIDRQGIKSWLWHDDKWYLDISVSGGIPVKSEDNIARKGMPDLGWSAELGPSIKYYWEGNPQADDYLSTEFYVRKVAATDFSSIDDAGWRSGFQLSNKKVFYFSENNQLEWETIVDVQFADESLLDYFYGVDPEYATEIRPEYTNNGGYAGSRISTGFVWKRNALWLGSFVTYYALNGTEQVSSPLVTTKSGWSYGLGVIWIFYQDKGK